jgi:hypothetical protein
MNRMEFSRTARVPLSKRYGNFIGGQWAQPVAGRYFQNPSPVNGQPLCLVARSDGNDIDFGNRAFLHPVSYSPKKARLLLNMEYGIMARPVDLFPLLRPQEHSAPFLGRRRQQDALYRTIPGAAQRRQNATMTAAETTDGEVRSLTRPNVSRQESPASR